MKFIIEYNDDIEIKFSKINYKICNSFIDWWTTGKINNEMNDKINVFGIDLDRHNIKSIKFEREKK